jgi:hypothetical protein
MNFSFLIVQYFHKIQQKSSYHLTVSKLSGSGGNMSMSSEQLVAFFTSMYRCLLLEKILLIVFFFIFSIKYEEVVMVIY